MKIFLYLLALSMVMAAPVLGAEYKAGETVIIPAGETIETDLFVGSREARIQGRVIGDVYAVCEQLRVEGDVTQDIQAGCRILTLTGRVGDDVIFLGQELRIEGEVAGDVIALGARVHMAPSAVIHGDLFAAAGEIDLEGGLIKGSLKGHTESAYLNGTIAGNTTLEVEGITYGPDFQTQGGTHLTLTKPLDDDQTGRLPENAEIVFKEPESAFPFGSIFGKLWSIAAALIVGLVFVLFFKDTTRDFLDFAKTGTLPNTGLGFVYLVVIPVAVLILFILVLTIPVALMVTALYLIALYLGSILASLSIGDRFMERFSKEPTARGLILPLIIGVIAIKLITAIPFIGWLIGLAVVCYGLGSLINFIWNFRKMSEAYAEA